MARELEARPGPIGASPSIADLTARIETLERQVAAGSAFITPEERPAVGTNVLKEDEEP